MTPRRAGEINLAADIFGSGTFAKVGAMRQPSLALNAAIADFRLEQEYPELRPVLVHMLATKIAGRCALESSEAERALMDCLAARLALEWVVTIPGIGTLRALFLIARLEKAEQAALFDLVLQLAGRPSFMAFQTEDAEAG